jgi:hypothetical protein
MTTFIAANLSLAFFALIVGLIERAHRRVSSRGPRVPLGADYSHDADLQRVLHDLDVARH